MHVPRPGRPSWLLLLLLIGLLPHYLLDGRGIVEGKVAVTVDRRWVTTVCACQCCFRGDCVTIPNTTRSVTGCGECSMAACEGDVAAVVRHSSDLAMDGSQGPGGGAAAGALQRSPCLSLTVSEMSACGGDPRCKRSTSLRARCVDRTEFFQKYSCLGAVVAITLFLIHATVKRAQRWLDSLA